MKRFLIICLCLIGLNLIAAFQYNIKGNQGYLTFDSKTTLSFEVGTTGKDNDHENFIDRGEGIIDYGWYNLETGKSGSFDNNSIFTFTENDKIGLYITDNNGNTYLSTKPKAPFEDDIWGKSKIVDGLLIIGGGNMGSNGTHEYYVFKINAVTNQNQAPTGQPLPGLIATLILGAVRNFLFEK